MKMAILRERQWSVPLLGLFLLGFALAVPVVAQEAVVEESTRGSVEETEQDPQDLDFSSDEQPAWLGYEQQDSYQDDFTDPVAGDPLEEPFSSRVRDYEPPSDADPFAYREEVASDSERIAALEKQVALLTAQVAAMREVVHTERFPEMLALESQDPDDLFNTGLAAIASQQLDIAVDAFNSYILRFPNGLKLAEAFFWLGELYMSMEADKDAQNAFTYLVENFPNHWRTPMAYFKLGVIARSELDMVQSEALFTRVLSWYPNTPAAALASEALKSAGFASQ